MLLAVQSVCPISLNEELYKVIVQNAIAAETTLITFYPLSSAISTEPIINVFSSKYNYLPGYSEISCYREQLKNPLPSL